MIEELPVLGFNGRDVTWMDRARCATAHVDPNVFFPQRGEVNAAAIAVCAGCPVKRPCLEFALANPEERGVWGGTSERQRKRMARNRRLMGATGE